MENIMLYKKQIHSINLNNSGTMNQQNLDFAKRTMLFDTIREHTELISTIQGYPNNDISDVDMTIDCVIMTTKKYNNLIKNQIGESNIQYIQFPKLEA